MSISRAERCADIAVRTIALESAVLTNTIAAVKGSLTPIRDFLSGSLFNFNGAPKPDHELTKNQLKLIQKVNGSNFLKLASLEVNVIPGLTATLPELKDNIDSALDYLQTFTAKITTPYYVQLSLFISNKEAKVTSRDGTQTYRNWEHDRDSRAKELARHFNDKVGTGVAPLGSLIPRAAELTPLFLHVNKVREQFDNIDFAAISEGVAKCVSGLDTIIEEANDGTFGEVSPEATKTLAEGAFEVGKQSEFASAQAVLILAYIGAVDNLYNALAAAEKDGKLTPVGESFTQVSTHKQTSLATESILGAVKTLFGKKGEVTKEARLEELLSSFDPAIAREKLKNVTKTTTKHPIGANHFHQYVPALVKNSPLPGSFEVDVSAGSFYPEAAEHMKQRIVSTKTILKFLDDLISAKKKALVLFKKAENTFSKGSDATRSFIQGQQPTTFSVGNYSASFGGGESILTNDASTDDNDIAAEVVLPSPEEIMGFVQAVNKKAAEMNASTPWEPWDHDDSNSNPEAYEFKHDLYQFFDSHYLGHAGGYVVKAALQLARDSILTYNALP